MIERQAPAKINLGLHVLRRRADGYHDIETVLYRIGWSDRITAAPGERLTMTCSDPALPTDPRNLCIQAAERLRETFDVDRGAVLHLDKHVPYGAGLGSGSSDAAATLRLLNELWELDAAAADLRSLAVQLGADVPFFLEGDTALATGRGDVLAPLRTASGGPYDLPFPLVVVVPDVHIATSDAYGMVQPVAGNRPDLAIVVRSNDVVRWRAELVNDFERSILKAYPAVGAAKEMLQEAGADYAALSGSGAAVYGVFTHGPSARAAAKRARADGHRVFLDAVE